MPLLTPLTSQVVSDTSEASATARQTAATAWRQVICSGKGRDSDREHSGSGRDTQRERQRQRQRQRVRPRP